MNLKPELIESLRRVGFVTATEVQERAIPEVLQHKNVIARAKTGTGKTGAFMIPIFQQMEHPRSVEALIIVPTRELALQVATFAEKVGSPLHIRTTTVYGGASINMQVQAIRSGANIVVGTPGRIIDLMSRGALELHKIKYVVLDEADIMLDMGFTEDVDYIISRTPHSRQMMLFSATMQHEITKMAERYTQGVAEKITVGQEEDIAVATIQHLYAIVPARVKFSALLAYIKEYAPKKAIIFARTKFEANTIHRVLVHQKYNAILLHGGLTQAMRERSLGHFRNGAQFMIATNVAARGLDIANVTDVINFGVPEEPTVYVHRIGRSARMGKEGRAFTLIDPDHRRELTDVQDYANVKMTKIELDLEPFRTLQLPIREEGRGFEGPRRGGFGGGGRRFNRQGGGNFHRDREGHREGEGHRGSGRGGFNRHSGFRRSYHKR